MKRTVYIETTIPSFYHATREDAKSVAMRDWTREWWDEHKLWYDCYTSLAAIDELTRGDHPQKEKKLEMASSLPRLEIGKEVLEITDIYIENFVMPRDAAGDALHLAVASHHKIDYLLTWNCVHLANANKLSHIRRINERLRIVTPEILTPMELGAPQ